MPAPQPDAASAEPSQQPIVSASLAITGSQTITRTVVLDGAGAAIVLSWYTGTAGLSLYDPAGVHIDPAALPVTVTYTGPTTSSLAALYMLDNPMNGPWLAVVTGTMPVPEAELLRLSAIATSTLGIKTTPAPGLHVMGRPLTITASLADGILPVTGATVTGTLLLPGGDASELLLIDDGADGDGTSGDGVYGMVMMPNAAGTYVGSLTATGTHAGTLFQRVDGFTFAIITGTAALSGPYTAGVPDTDRDGLYNSLTITAGVTVSQAGVFYLAGALWSSSGSLVMDATGPTKTLPMGSGVLTVPFAGSQIAQSGINGPYVLAALRLVDVRNGAATLIDEKQGVVTTTAYLAGQFERADLRVPAGVPADQGVDTNADGRYDYLRLTVPVDAVYAGAYSTSVALTDLSGTLVSVIGQQSILAGGNNSLALDFPGMDITTRRVGGPYVLQSLGLTNIASPTIALTQQNIYTTSVYTLSQFEADMIAPTATTSVAVTQPLQTSFTVTWSATDPAPSSGVAAYDVQYRVGESARGPIGSLALYQGTRCSGRPYQCP